MSKILKKDVDAGKTELDIKKSLKCDIITTGLRQALATGNWGKDKNGDVLRTGVAQVLNRLTF